MIEAGDIGLLVLLGTWAALDGSSVAQVLISRPLVSSTLTGWILGDAGAGLLVGTLLEGLHLGDVPAGGAKLPEPGPAGVPAAAAFVGLGGGGGLAVGLALGTVLSALGGATVVAQRHLNGVVLRPLSGASVKPGRLARRHWACIGIDAARGAVLTAAGLGLALAVPPVVAERWALSLPASIALFTLPALLSAGALLRGWLPSWGKRALFAAGCAGGLAIAVVV